MTNRTRIIFFVLMAGACLAGYKVSLSLLPYNPIALSSSERLEMLTVLPEGWAFFTRDPRASIVFVYKKGNNGWERVNVPGASRKYSFGLNRKGVALGPEISELLAQIPDSIWSYTEAPIDGYLRKTVMDTTGKRKEFHLSDGCPEAACLGEVIIQKTTLLPWAWAKTHGTTVMPSYIAKVYVDDLEKN